jgi:hypothetical protein
VTRIDLTTREWHELIKPVIPHASTDPDERELAVIRVEGADRAFYAVATDRRTLAAERHPLNGTRRLGMYVPHPVHVRVSDAKSSLTLFPFSKDSDPPLRLTIDKTTVPVLVAGRPDTVDRLAITLEGTDGTRLVLHDHRDSSNDPLGGWRRTLAGLVNRPVPALAPALNLNAVQLARWGAAVRKGERLAVFTGAKGDQSLLVAVDSWQGRPADRGGRGDGSPP